MPADTTAKAVQVLDLMLEFFADDNHWTRGRPVELDEVARRRRPATRRPD